MARPANVVDADRYGQYASRVSGIISRYGGAILARGGAFEVLEGDNLFERFVVVAFPSMEAARACHASAEYAEAAAFRRSGAGQNECVVVAGV
ncbi:DUF1330 domain-containing protein [Nocardioides immobilis]|uniref:DUF1330 domain-containing protein n=1 Tax=Nocardioides immobilis TaxID=2049295 RepID=A0A417XWN6_9ACTN|nr:DUF1330 domain-containing protein [Nocardioides immobilis]